MKWFVSLTKVDNYLERLDHTHIVLFHEGGKERRQTEYGFFQRGLEKNQHCFYTTQKPKQVLDEMKDFGIDVDKYKDKFEFTIFNEPFQSEAEAIVALEKFEALFIMR